MPHIVFLMSDTGGGHRAASRAIEAALQKRAPGEFTVELVDVWKDYTRFPFNTLPRNYSRWINIHPWSYSALYWIGDQLSKMRWWSRFYCWQMHGQMSRLYAEHPADIIVCVHAAFVRPAVYALRKTDVHKPFFTVITDYAWPTAMWYDRDVTGCLVPTEPARRRGLSLGLAPSQIHLTGAPAHPKFSDIGLSKSQARAQLGWPSEKPVVLLAGGGDGTGELIATARAIDERQLGCELVVLAGRNDAMKTALEAVAWKGSTRIYAFVENIEVFMRASDLLLSKAGPATITEAALLGLPLVLSGAIKYQESPNVDYVVKHKAGIYAPGAKRTAECVERLLTDGGTELQRLAAGIKRIAQPDAIWNIADEIRAYAS